MNYLYDGTFEGFLTCVYEHYYSGRADGIFACTPDEPVIGDSCAEGAERGGDLAGACAGSGSNSSIADSVRGGAGGDDVSGGSARVAAYQPDMLIASHMVSTDPEKAGRVETAIRDKLSPYVLARVYRVFRTSTEGKEMLLLNYIRFSFKHGYAASFLRTHPLVLPVAKAEEKIGNEVHRLCGLIRFSAVSVRNGAAPAAPARAPAPCADSVRAAPAAPRAREILSARVAPDHEVLEFLAPHFSDRFKSEPFIIHDTKRGRALISFNRRWHITDFSGEDAALFGDTSGEIAYKKLWRRYFDIIAIKERRNPRCQRNLMPARYWDNLPEMQPS
jgi:probable DNA metabolism protein